MKPLYITLHCSDTYSRMDIGFKEINEWHLARGWKGCGYHKIIRRDGSIEDGRSLNIQGAHVANHNNNNIGICVVGGRSNNNGMEDNFTEEQYKSLSSLIKELQEEFNITIENVKGHNEWRGHESRGCPVFSVDKFKEEYLLKEEVIPKIPKQECFTHTLLKLFRNWRKK
jgi:N-acetylmuramoyl-L-alanine amidase